MSSKLFRSSPSPAPPTLCRSSPQYPESTFKIPVAIDALTKRGIKYKSIPKDRAPFDFAESRRTFVREVINFRPQYGKPVKMQDSVAFDESVGKVRASALSNPYLSPYLIPYLTPASSPSARCAPSPL
jgi:hypothetical protein